MEYLIILLMVIHLIMMIKHVNAPNIPRKINSLLWGIILSLVLAIIGLLYMNWIMILSYGICAGMCMYIYRTRY